MVTRYLHNEKELLRLLVKGNESAFAALFQLHHQRIGSFVKHVVGDNPSVEELVQDIFMKLWVNRERLNEVENLSAYLYAIARNHMFTYLKKTGKELASRNEWAANSLSWQDTYQNPVEEENLYKDLLNNAVGQLSSQQRRVYLLSRDEGLTHAEIAEQLSISLETVKKHMVLALRNIRQQMIENKNKIMLRILLSYFLL